MEGILAYHVISANHTFKSADCASKIFRSCFKMKKFTCSRVLNVIAPQVRKMLIEDLKKCSFVSVSVDASNYGSIKIFPVLVRSFIPTVGVCVKVLEISSEDIFSKCKDFFDDACEYHDIWGNPIVELKKYSWVSLRQIPSWTNVEEAISQLDEKSLYDSNENSAQLHKEFCYVKNYCSDSKKVNNGTTKSLNDRALG